MDTTNRLTKWTGHVESDEALPVVVVALETVGNRNRSCGYFAGSLVREVPDAARHRTSNWVGATGLSKFKTEETVEARLEGCSRIELNVDHQGNVHPFCMDFSGGYIWGKLGDRGVVEIWERSRAQFRDHYFGGYSKEVCRNARNLRESECTIACG